MVRVKASVFADMGHAMRARSLRSLCSLRTLRFYVGLIFSAICMGAMSAQAQAQAQTASAPGEWGVFVGTGLRSNLADILPHALKGQWVLESDRLVGVMWRPAATRWDAWGLQQGLEWGAYKHSGLSQVAEWTGAWRLASTWATVGNLQLGAAAGLGLSVTSGFPAYDGAGVADKSQLHRTLFYFAPEVTVAPQGGGQGAPGWQASLRVHHRCGVYGLVAPSKVGSNHVGLTGVFRY